VDITSHISLTSTLLMEDVFGVSVVSSVVFGVVWIISVVIFNIYVLFIFLSDFL